MIYPYLVNRVRDKRKATTLKFRESLVEKWLAVTGSDGVCTILPNIPYLPVYFLQNSKTPGVKVVPIQKVIIHLLGCSFSLLVCTVNWSLTVHHYCHWYQHEYRNTKSDFYSPRSQDQILNPSNCAPLVTVTLLLMAKPKLGLTKSRSPGSTFWLFTSRSTA